jgi:hypothetical protein
MIKIKLSGNILNTTNFPSPQCLCQLKLSTWINYPAGHWGF